MKRDLSRLASRRFDLAVVGGGILGAYVAREGAARGLRVALVERGDFASGTTSGSGKVLHGGIRPLRDLRLRAALEQRRARRTITGRVPHLVRPLPFFVGFGNERRSGSLLPRAASWIGRSFERLAPHGLDLPGMRHVHSSREAGLEGRWSHSCPEGLLVHELQLRSPERLTVEVLRDAVELGAVVANYAECVAVRSVRGAVAGLAVRDVLGDREVEVDATRVVNATGAWAREVVGDAAPQIPRMRFGKGTHVVLDRPEPPVALALPFRDGAPKGGRDDGRRRVFIVPWEGRTLVGAAYRPCGDDPARGTAPRAAEVRAFLEALDRQWPDLALGTSPVLYSYSGLYPVFGQDRVFHGEYAASKDPAVIDHHALGGPRGLVSAIAVKLTTAPTLARRVLELVRRDSAPDDGPASGRADRPTEPWSLNGAGRSDAAGWGPPPGESVSLREVARRATEEEMACRLTDVLFRRSWIGHLGHPGVARLEEAAALMGDRLGWSPRERERQVRVVDELYRSRGATIPADRQRAGTASRRAGG